MTYEEMVQDKIEVVEEEIQEKDKEDTGETLTKPTAEKICKAINRNTFRNCSMFTESSEIGTITTKASTVFEKDLCESMNQTSISDFFKKNYIGPLM